MTRFVLHELLAKKSVTAACLFVAASFTPLALAQHPGRPVGSAPGAAAGRIVPPRVAAPPVSRAPIVHPPMPQPRVVVRPPFIDVGVANLGFRHRIGHPIFIRAPFFGFRANFASLWWLNCGPVWGWQYGCGNLFLYPYGVEATVTPPLRFENPVYVYPLYGAPDHQLVELFLKDGTTIAVSDYWFVNDDIHFLTPDEDAPNSEQVIGLDELDLQKTINVNTRRGFRFVRRDEPMEQWLRDHPDTDPPLILSPQKSEAPRKP